MAKKGKAKAVFLTALVLYAGMQGTTLNKSASTNIALTNKPLTAADNSVQKEKRQPQEIMFLFEDQYLVPELQEAPKIKKKKK